MINKIILVGRVGKEPEIKDNFASISVATTYRWFDKNKNQWANETEWHRCTLFGPRIEVCKRLSKGTIVYIEGRLKTSQYEKDGQQRQSVSIIVDKINPFAGNKNGDHGKSSEVNNATISNPFGDIEEELKNSKFNFDSSEIPF